MRRANGTGTIVKLGGKRRKPFAVKVTVGYNDNGYAIQVPIEYFKERTEADLFLAEYNKNPFIIDITKYQEKIWKKTKILSASNVVDKTAYTFEEVFNELSELYFPTEEEVQNEKETHIKAKGKLGAANSKNLRAAYNNSIKLHSRVYRDLRTIDFQAIIDCTEGKDTKIKNLATLYKKMDDYAKQKDIIEKGYAEYVVVEAVEQPKQRVPFSNEEIMAIWNFVPTPKKEKEIKYCLELIRDITLFLLYSGFRIEEALFAETENINMQEGYIKGGLKTKNGKNRIVPIHHKVKPVIKKYYDASNKFLFNINGKKIEYTFFKYRFDKMMDTLSINHVVHETRHTIRSEFDRVNANKKCVDLILGHQSDDIGLRTYTHKTLEELKETIELITYEIDRKIYLLSNY